MGSSELLARLRQVSTSNQRRRGSRWLALTGFGALIAFGCGPTARNFGEEATAGTAGASEAGALNAGAGAGTGGKSGVAGSSSSAGSAIFEAGTGGDASAGEAGEAGSVSVGGSGAVGGTGGSGGVGAAGLNSGGSAGTSGGASSVGGSAGHAGALASGGSAGAAAVVPPSCVGLAATCGPTGSSSCCSAHPVTGGTFHRQMGIDTASLATVADYILDDYEITVGRFRKFVAAYATHKPVSGAGSNPHNAADAGWDSAWNSSLPADLEAQVDCGGTFQTYTQNPGANEVRPINCISWFTAEAFCIWDGGRLPTLAEWNYAATGGAQQRYYPWSDPKDSQVIDDSYASYYVDDTKQCYGDMINGCALTDLIRVGSKPNGNGRYLQADLGGNVSEWVQDWAGTTSELPTPCTNCANLTPGTWRVMMGGDFKRNAYNQSVGGSSATAPTYTNYALGARCARN